MTQAAASRWQVLRADDGVEVHWRRWQAAGPVRGLVQIAHGAVEHSGRYERFGQALAEAGFVVAAMDHRGHGRTRVRSGALGDAGPDGWNRIVGDEIALSASLRSEHPGARLALYGHSLGSFMAQDLLTRGAPLPDALVLSGTAWRAAPPPQVLDLLEQRASADPLGPSQFWSDRFKDYNAAFGGPTGREWLSRDPAQVKAYVEDPLCNFPFSNELVRDMFRAFAQMRAPEREARLPRGLPVLVLQGEHDPIGGEGQQAAHELVRRWRESGLEVDVRIYPGARHEPLNETNRDEVMRDMLAWLQRHIAR